MSFLLIFLFPALMSNLTVPKNDNPLSGAEKEGLVYTLEEARLAQNVNAYLHDKWQEPMFEYVLNDETNNILKFQKFIKKEGGADPLGYAVNGKFNIPSMQDEYNKYIMIGKKYMEALIRLMGTQSNYFIDILFIVCSLTFAVCVFIIYTNLISFIFDLEWTFCNM